MKPRRTRAARKCSPRRDEGFTLIELLIAIVLLAGITGAIAAVMVTSLGATRTTSEKAHESTDAQLIATYLVRDAQSAGGSNPGTGLPDPSLGVGTDAAGCGSSTGLVVRFKWTDRWQLGPQFVHTNVANIHGQQRHPQLTRHFCVDGGTAADVTLGTRVSERGALEPFAMYRLPAIGHAAVGRNQRPSQREHVQLLAQCCTAFAERVFPDTATASRILIALMALGGPTCLNGTTGVAGKRSPQT